MLFPYKLVAIIKNLDGGIHDEMLFCGNDIAWRVRSFSVGLFSCDVLGFFEVSG
jgi:hypothetical protein